MGWEYWEMEKHDIDFCLFMALTDNNKNTLYHQPYLLISWCKCYFPLAPVTRVALTELDKVHQYSATDMTLHSSLTQSIQNMAAMCSSWVSTSESSSIHWRYIIQKQEQHSVSFFSHLRSAAYRLSESVPVFCGRRKVTACGFAKIITKWLVEYKRPLHTCLSKWKLVRLKRCAPSLWDQCEPM